MEIEQLVRKNILALKPYSSARDEYSGEDAILMDANENPFETAVNRYPDPYQRAIKKKLSQLKNIKDDSIFLGNGSDEAIDLLLRIFCEPGRDEIIITDPTYGMYEVSASINEIGVNKVPLKDDFRLSSHEVLDAVRANTKIIFLCSPNNPSGNLLDTKEVDQIIKQFEGIVVIDEAYIDFAEQPSYVEQLEEYANLVVLQTFSKAWGMAGVRLGMAFSSKFIIDLLNKVKPPYNINRLTQDFVLKMLSAPELIKDKTDLILKNRSELIAALKEVHQVDKIYPTDSNFILVRFRNAERVFKYLMEENIILRDRTRVLHGKNCLRITVGTKEENIKLIEALKQL